MISYVSRLLTGSSAKAGITVTSNAWNKMAEIINSQKAYSFVFSAVGGGCSGYNYDLQLLDIDQHQRLYDDFSSSSAFPCTVLQGPNNRGLLLIDPLSEVSLLGTTIDYVTEDYRKGMFENKFVFIADATMASTCGCGISFTPKERT